MKRWSVILSVLALTAAGVWCWLYRAYDGVVQQALTASGQDLHSDVGAGLDAFEQSRQAQVINRIQTFRERLAYLRAVALAKIGDEKKADALFTQLASAQQSHIAQQSLYNKAHSSVRTGALEEARDQYRKALVMDPGDLQAKINLELLLVRMQEEAAAAKKQGDKQGQQPPSMSDYWTREDPLVNSPSAGSKRIWK